MCGGTWWDQFTCRLTTPEWAANSGVPLLFTMLGIGLAAFLVQRQLRSDKGLRRAEVRYIAAQALGSHLLEVADKLAVSRSDNYWKASRWPDKKRVTKALADSGRLAKSGLPLSHIQQASRAIGDSWLLLEAERVEERPADWRHGTAMKSCLAPLGGALKAFGRELQDWDGLPPYPELAVDFDSPEEEMSSMVEFYRAQVREPRHRS